MGWWIFFAIVLAIFWVSERIEKGESRRQEEGRSPEASARDEFEALDESFDSWHMHLALPKGSVSFKVLLVQDGDTVKGKIGTEEVWVRLACIDAPESGQECGWEAKRSLKKWLSKGVVRIRGIGYDRYERKVADLFVWHDGKWVNVNWKLVEEGWAWVYEDYLEHLDGLEAYKLKKIQEQAQATKMGLWGESKNPVPPWEWRRQG